MKRGAKEHSAARHGRTLVLEREQLLDEILRLLLCISGGDEVWFLPTADNAL